MLLTNAHLHISPEGGAAARATDSFITALGSVFCSGWFRQCGGVCREACSYDLTKRGFCVITGRNEDDQGSESNGAGKSALVMAPLWALTGKSDARNEVDPCINTNLHQSHHEPAPTFMHHTQ